MIVIAIFVPLILIFGILLLTSLRSKLKTANTELDTRKIENEKLTEENVELTTEIELQKIENMRFALNPHSFRNTLTTIESRAKSTYESVHSLSGIFDYMLYDAKSRFVPLEQELKFIRSYLSLYELKLSPVVDVKLYVHPTIDDLWSESKKIAPLIFAHFIENAFKHGELSANDGFFAISIEPIDDDILVYTVKNRVKRFKEHQKGGIGNNAFFDRLKLLYKNNHQLNYAEKEDVYIAILTLNLYHD